MVSIQRFPVAHTRTQLPRRKKSKRYPPLNRDLPQRFSSQSPMNENTHTQGLMI